MSDAAEIASRYRLLAPKLNERDTRLFAAVEARIFGRGGVAALHRITGLARTTIRRGMEELSLQEALEAKAAPIPGDGSAESARIRRHGGGRKSVASRFPDLIPALERSLEPAGEGGPESPLSWTTKSAKTLAEELRSRGVGISPNSVIRQLRLMGFHLQPNLMSFSGTNYPDRNAQFEHINKIASDYLNNNNPVIAITTIKRILSNKSNNIYENKPLDDSIEKVNKQFSTYHDMPHALPFGIYDIDSNINYLIVGTHHDTTKFITNSIYGWWVKYGSVLYPNVTKLLLITTTTGNFSNKIHLWKYSLQSFADKIKFPISVSHFLPGTSKWNIVENELFSLYLINWADEPLNEYKIVIKLISKSKQFVGPQISCILDYSNYKPFISLTQDQISSISLIRDELYGCLNYTILPH